MQYTFAQAQKRLAGRTHGFGGGDVKDGINDAIQALAGLSGWECLRRVLRFSSVGPRISLPQGSAGLVRLCMNGRPLSVRSQDFRFIQSGPGDLRRPPHGFRLLKPENVLDVGKKPVVIEPPAPFRLLAYSDGDNEPCLTVRGVAIDGRDTVVHVPMTESPVYDPVSGELVSGVELVDAELSTVVLQTIVEVTLDDCAAHYVTLFAADELTDERYPIALYHPFVKAPRFRQYMIPEVAPGQPVDILAEVRIEPLPLVRDTDVVPFDSLEPIEWMMRANWCMQSGEVDAAGKYQSYAEKWLKSRELVDDVVQTSVVINNAFSNSLGELSVEAWNI